jgi:hypothetical protein
VPTDFAMISLHRASPKLPSMSKATVLPEDAKIPEKPDPPLLEGQIISLSFLIQPSYGLTLNVHLVG